MTEAFEGFRSGDHVMMELDTGDSVVGVLTSADVGGVYLYMTHQTGRKGRVEATDDEWRIFAEELSGLSDRAMRMYRLLKRGGNGMFLKGSELWEVTLAEAVEEYVLRTQNDRVLQGLTAPVRVFFNNRVIRKIEVLSDRNEEFVLSALDFDLGEAVEDSE